MRFLSVLALVFLCFSPPSFAADKPNYKEVVIAAGTSESSLFDISNITPGNGSALGLFLPSTWTAANITLLVSSTCSAPWYNAYDGAGNEYKIAAAASRYVGLDAAYFVGVRCIKFVSGTSSAPVNQAASRTIRIGYGRFNQ